VRERGCDAVERLVAAHRAARRLGAAPLAARLADDLSGLGEPLERRIGRLAAAEFEPSRAYAPRANVIRRIAAGQTDREIARALFLSPRTVETHVRHIKEKLNCRSRADTARRAAELGLVSEPGLASQQ
jgi:DNA-binding NarL/FixJ family response regulator